MKGDYKDIVKEVLTLTLTILSDYWIVLKELKTEFY